MVGIKFEHRHDKHPTVKVGPFLWVQCTYDVMRVSRDEADNGDIELAWLGGSNSEAEARGEFEEGWVYEGKIYTDAIIFAWKED